MTLDFLLASTIVIYMCDSFSQDNSKEKCFLCEIVRHAQMAGTEKHVFLLTTHFNKSIFKASVCTFEYGELVERLKEHGFATKIIPQNHSLLHFLKLLAFIRQHKFDIIHCHSGGYACIAARLAGTKRVVYTKHGIGFTAEELQKRNFLRKLRDFLVDKCVALYIALTEFDKHIMTQVLHIDKKKITVVYNGIDLSFGRITLLQKTNYPTIGVVGRLTNQKGISYLINAIPAVMKKFTTVKVLIAGSGKEEKKLKDLACKRGIALKIDFLGYVKNVAEVINRMDVFVLPSVWEGFPYVLLEAMLLKKPIVATNIFGVDEIIEHGKTGILVEPKNPDSIADAVIELLNDKKKAKTLGAAAHKRVLDRFTLDKTVSKIEQLYYSLL